MAKPPPFIAAKRPAKPGTPPAFAAKTPSKTVVAKKGVPYPPKNK